MTLAKVGQAALLAVAASLSGVTAAAATSIGPSPQRGSRIELAQAEDNCRQTTSQLDIYEQPDRNSAVVGSIGRGDRVSIRPRAGNDGWARINIPQDGYILASYLQACRSSTEGGSTRLQPNDTVLGCGQVVDLGVAPTGTPDLLSLYSVLDGGANAPYDAIAPRGAVALGPSVYRGGRYWVSVLAYRSVNPGQAIASSTGQAWAAESGPNAPEALVRNASGSLVYRTGSAYPDLNIVRRSCRELFSDFIAEDQPLPSQLPRGFRTP